jgi:hypothetical protein
MVGFPSEQSHGDVVVMAKSRVPAAGVEVAVSSPCWLDSKISNSIPRLPVPGVWKNGKVTFLQAI